MFDILPRSRKEVQSISSFRNELNQLFNRFFDFDEWHFHQGTGRGVSLSVDGYQ